MTFFQKVFYAHFQLLIANLSRFKVGFDLFKLHIFTNIEDINSLNNRVMTKKGISKEGGTIKPNTGGVSKEGGSIIPKGGGISKEGGSIIPKGGGISKEGGSIKPKVGK